MHHLHKTLFPFLNISITLMTLILKTRVTYGASLITRSCLFLVASFLLPYVPMSSHRERRGFLYCCAPSIISHVSRFSCSPFPIRTLQSCSRPPSFSVHSPQRQFNKGPRHERREREPIKGERGGDGGGGGEGRAERDGEKSEMVKKMDEKSGIDREKARAD